MAQALELVKEGGQLSSQEAFFSCFLHLGKPQVFSRHLLFRQGRDGLFPHLAEEWPPSVCPRREEAPLTGLSHLSLTQ